MNSLDFIKINTDSEGNQDLVITGRLTLRLPKSFKLPFVKITNIKMTEGGTALFLDLDYSVGLAFLRLTRHLVVTYEPDTGFLKVVG